ncbi:MAG: histidine kinase [Acidobacteria bacterium]|nr:histidine kinase [Acidobacteriota bacterium]
MSKIWDRTRLRRVGTKLLLWLCLCTLVGLFFSVRGTDGITLESARSNLPRWYVWGALTPLIVWADRRYAAESPTRRLLLHLAGSLFWIAVFVVALFAVNCPLAGQPCTAAAFAAKVPADFIAGFQWNALVYWSVVGGWLAWDYYHKSRNRELKALQLERLLADARLRTLQTQLQPHFLFNALNTISALVERDPARTRRVIEHLGDLLRFSLDNSARQFTTLEDDLGALEHFLAIQRVRFEDQLQVQVSAEAETLRATVPTLLLQPLVENAIRHGVAQQRRSHVTVSASRVNGDLRLRVVDDGPGLPSGWEFAADAGIGLSNTRERLTQLYPSAHQFSVRAVAGGGVLAEVVIPFHEQ